MGKNIRDRINILLGEGGNSRKSTFIVKAIGVLITFSILLAILAMEPVTCGPNINLTENKDASILPRMTGIDIGAKDTPIV